MTLPHRAQMPYSPGDPLPSNPPPIPPGDMPGPGEPKQAPPPMNLD